MEFRNYSLLCILLMIIQINSLIHAESYSVKVGDTLVYSIKDQGDEGNIEITVDEILFSSVNSTNPNAILGQVLGTIIGEFHDDIITMEVKSGWRALLYMNSNTTISFKDSAYSLHSMIYEGIYPFVWPIDEEFYENFGFVSTSQIENIQIEKDGEIWIITEKFDQTPLDGCLCETIIKIENGIMTSLFQNETVYFTVNGPVVKTSLVTLLEFQTSREIELPFFDPISLIILIPIIALRYGTIAREWILALAG